MARIEHLHKHIDNGGISVEVDYDSDNGHTSITFDTQYFGYPAITSTLSTWGVLPEGDAAFLKELGLMLLRASDKLNRERAEKIIPEIGNAVDAGSADDLRKLGWIVAVHNDYRYHGVDFTFWLLTEPGGRWLKGEGTSDAAALNNIRAQLDAEKEKLREEQGGS